MSAWFRGLLSGVICRILGRGGGTLCEFFPHTRLILFLAFGAGLGSVFFFHFFDAVDNFFDLDFAVVFCPALLSTCFAVSGVGCVVVVHEDYGAGCVAAAVLVIVVAVGFVCSRVPLSP